jgi:hypothetical protein
MTICCKQDLVLVIKIKVGNNFCVAVFPNGSQNANTVNNLINNLIKTKSSPSNPPYKMRWKGGQKYKDNIEESLGK